MLAKKHLIRILESFTSKFAVLNNIIDKMLAMTAYSKNYERENDSATSLRNVVDLEFLAPIRTSVVSYDHRSFEIVKGTFLIVNRGTELTLKIISFS